MVSASDSTSSGPGSSPVRGHCVVFLERHFTVSLFFNTRANPAMDNYPIQGRVGILLVVSCYRLASI